MAKRPKKQSQKIVLITISGILLSLVLFNLLFVSLSHPSITALDKALSEQIYTIRTPLLTDIMQVITSFGDILLIAGGILVSTLLIWKKETREGLFFLSVLLFGVGLNLLIKEIIQRPRPDIAPLVALSSYSFPSGHAMNAFIFYSLLIAILFHLTKNKLLRGIVTVLSSLLILLIGFSRVYLGVHYPTDILAGFLWGMVIFLPALFIFRRQIFQ